MYGVINQGQFRKTASCLCKTPHAFRRWYVMNGGEESRILRRSIVSESQCSPAVWHELGWLCACWTTVAWCLETVVTLFASRNTQWRAISRHRLTCWDCMEPKLHSLIRRHLLLKSSNRPAPEYWGLLCCYGRSIDRRLFNEDSDVIFKCRSVFAREFGAWNLKQLEACLLV